MNYYALFLFCSQLLMCGAIVAVFAINIIPLIISFCQGVKKDAAEYRRAKAAAPEFNFRAQFLQSLINFTTQQAWIYKMSRQPGFKQAFKDEVEREAKVKYFEAKGRALYEDKHNSVC